MSQNDINTSSTISETVIENAENVISDSNNEYLQYNQTVNIKAPKTKSITIIDTKYIQKIENDCKEVKNRKISWTELLLGIATLFIGTLLGAVISQVPNDGSLLGVFSYSICPVMGAGFGVAYGFCKWHHKNTDFELAENVLDYLSDAIEEDDIDELE